MYNLTFGQKLQKLIAHMSKTNIEEEIGNFPNNYEIKISVF